jgi:aspartate carbamoyltransferase catalytic subunit
MYNEASSRTRASFELAAKNLSADTVNLDASKSSVTKGESFIDNLRTIQALGADVIIIRHSQSGAPYLAARSVNAHIINAGDGWHAHPSQCLLDTYTIRKHLGTLENKKIVIVGDVLHSRVAHSNLWGMSKLGAHVVLCGPQTLMPLDMAKFLSRTGLSQVTIEPVIEKAVKDADVVMALRLQMERQQAGLLPTVREYVRHYAITEKRLRLAKPGALLLHPGPVNEGIELNPEVAYGAQSVIEEQVTNGVAIRMALLYLICGGKRK